MIACEVLRQRLELETEETLFSPHAVDRGTLAMLSKAEFLPGDRVLDLGCGYGVVGILAARLAGPERVVLCDLSETAVDCARRNAERNGVAGLKVVVSDGFDGIRDSGFQWILSNPPYHTDFSVAKRFIEGGFRRLVVGGRMLMVTKRRDWYRNKLASVFGGVKVWEIDGYFVFLAEKRGERPAPNRKEKVPGLSRKLRRKRERINRTEKTER